MRARSRILIVLLLSGILVAAYFAFFYLPSPTKVTSTYNCIQIRLPSSNSSATTVAFLVNGTNLHLVVKPPSPGLRLSGCFYTSTNTTTAIRCGEMCGGGVRYEYSYAKELGFNLSSVQELATKSSNYTVTLSTQGTPLDHFFWADFMSVYVNSQQVSWTNTFPLCTKRNADCIDQNSTSLTFQFPVDLSANDTYSMLINSSATALP